MFVCTLKEKKNTNKQTMEDGKTKRVKQINGNKSIQTKMCFILILQSISIRIIMCGPESYE